MSSVINTNSLSLLTQNNLTKSQSALTTSIQRLSSGLRINSAKDDAAGQAIANRFTASIKGLAQSQRNANDGISLAQTTEGALNEINNNLQRVRELTVQASNGSNSKSDLDSIQSEIGQRMAEIDRTSAQTDFNGTKVLGAAAGTLKIQVGANDGETIDIGLQTINTTTLNVASFNVNGTGTVNTAATKVSLLAVAGVAANGVPVNGTQQYDKITANAAATSANVFSKLADNNTVTYTGADTGLGVAATADTYTFNATSNSFSFNATGAADTAAAAYLTPSSGSKAATVTIGTNASQEIKIDDNGDITAADDGAKLYLNASGNLSKTNAGGEAQATALTLTASMALAGAGDTIADGSTVFTADASNDFSVVGATISAADFEAAADTGGYATSTGYTVANSVGLNAVTKTNGGMPVKVDTAGALTLDVNTVTSYFEQSDGVVTDGSGNKVYNDSAVPNTFTLNARSGSTSTTNAMSVIDAALAKVDALRSSLGAVQNRFDSVISNLGSTITNLASSRSRIEDADYATEVSNMTRAQILQQAGTSVLSKANQSTEGVMSLLR